MLVQIRLLVKLVLYGLAVITLLESFQEENFRYLINMKYDFSFLGNEISDVNPESWRGLEESLQTLNLANNAIAYLPGSVFSALQTLESLDLSGNAIMDFDTTVFAGGPPRLVRLNLADNQLRHVPYRQVFYLKYVITLNHSESSFYTVPSDIRAIVFISLYPYQIECQINSNWLLALKFCLLKQKCGRQNALEKTIKCQLKSFLEGNKQFWDDQLWFSKSKNMLVTMFCLNKQLHNPSTTRSIAFLRICPKQLVGYV